jgi:CRP-like cAMP-binding protein
MRTKLSRQQLELFRGAGLFDGLTNAELARVHRFFTIIDLDAGRVLTTEGTTGRQAFIVLSGVAEVTIAGRRVATVGPGEVVGEMALLDRQPRTATVTAVEAMRVLVADPRSFHSLLADPRIARKVLDVEVHRLRVADSSQIAAPDARR